MGLFDIFKKKFKETSETTPSNVEVKTSKRFLRHHQIFESFFVLK